MPWFLVLAGHQKAGYCGHVLVLLENQLQEEQLKIQIIYMFAFTKEFSIWGVARILQKWSILELSFVTSYQLGVWILEIANRSWINSSPPSAIYMRQWTGSTALLSTRPLGSNFSEIVTKIENFSFTKLHLKIASAYIARITNDL